MNKHVKCFLKLLFCVPYILMAFFATFVIQLPYILVRGLLDVAGCFEYDGPGDPWFLECADWYRQL